MFEAELNIRNRASSVLGEMVLLYSISPLHRKWQIESIRRWLIPPVANGNFKLYRRGEKVVGFVTWAFLDREAEVKYALRPASLEMGDWNSGERLWFIDFVAPDGDAKEILKDLREREFPNSIARFLRAKPDQKRYTVCYAHGKNALEKRRDRQLNSPVLASTHL